MNDFGRTIGVMFFFMSIYYLILFFRIEKCISVIKRIEMKLDSIRPIAASVADKREAVPHD